MPRLGVSGRRLLAAALRRAGLAPSTGERFQKGGAVALHNIGGAAALRRASPLARRLRVDVRMDGMNAAEAALRRGDERGLPAGEKLARAARSA